MQNVSDKVPTNKNNVFEDISTNSHRADTFRKNKLQIELQQSCYREVFKKKSIETVFFEKNCKKVFEREKIAFMHQ